MACEHFQPKDLIELAENYCLEHEIQGKSEKEGLRFSYTENVDAWGHKSILTEVTCREGQWFVTKLERSPNEVAEELLGFKKEEKIDKN